MLGFLMFVFCLFFHAIGTRVQRRLPDEDALRVPSADRRSAGPPEENPLVKRQPVAFNEAEEYLHGKLDMTSDDAPRYLSWIADLCEPHLGARTLEVGSGHGAVTERFVDGCEFVATDIWEPSVELLRQRFAGKPNVSVLHFDALADPAPGSYDSVLMINVLEHLPDDAAPLRTVYDMLDDRGNVVLYIPAFQFLYSGFDRKAGHYRRYRKKQLRATLQGAGFDLKTSRYVNAPSVPIWWLFSRVPGPRSRRRLVSTCVGSLPDSARSPSRVGGETTVRAHDASSRHEARPSALGNWWLAGHRLHADAVAPIGDTAQERPGYAALEE